MIYLRMIVLNTIIFLAWNQIGYLYIAEIIKLGVYTGLHDRRIKPLDF